jgi:hypothetical protein
VIGFLKTLLGDPPAARGAREPAPLQVAVDGAGGLPIAAHFSAEHGFPIADWAKVQEWVDALPEARRAAAWAGCERAWLLHFRDALGPGFHLDESDGAVVLSSLEPHVARATLDFMSRSARRIGAVLDGIAAFPPWGKDILILFDDDESYYRYVSYYYPERGEFAFSGGMCIHRGCLHFVSVKNELRQIEAMIVHEMTHASVAHLPMPLWLNEGLAVNTERRLAGSARADRTPEQMHDRHRRFWSVVSIQEFWSGRSFDEPGESNTLSYDLARIVVETLALQDWAAFTRFVHNAKHEDAGAAAARECLGFDLGEIVTTLLERDTPKSWSPNPEKWRSDEPV